MEPDSESLSVEYADISPVYSQEITATRSLDRRHRLSNPTSVRLTTHPRHPFVSEPIRPVSRRIPAAGMSDDDHCCHSHLLQKKPRAERSCHSPVSPRARGRKACLPRWTKPVSSSLGGTFKHRLSGGFVLSGESSTYASSLIAEEYSQVSILTLSMPPEHPRNRFAPPYSPLGPVL